MFIAVPAIIVFGNTKLNFKILLLIKINKLQKVTENMCTHTITSLDRLQKHIPILFQILSSFIASPMVN